MSDINPFTNHNMKLVSGDLLYLFSDGFIDQFGSSKNIKYGRKRFKELILSFEKETIPKQHQILESSLKNWIEAGTEKQIDDVCVMGIKI